MAAGTRADEPGTAVAGSQEAIAALRKAGAIDASITPADAAAVGIRVGAVGWQVMAWAPGGEPPPAGAAGTSAELGGGALIVGESDHGNAVALRRLVPWLRPRTIGRATSVGVGDRLGIATPGHVAAFRANPGIVPVLAQQSARELARTGRTFADVVDAATFGALAAGWRDGFGADADHLKTIADIDGGIGAGCTMFTADPIELVPDLPADAPADAVNAAFASVPWSGLEDDPAAFASRYPDRLNLDSGPLELNLAALRSAAARFGAAVVQVAAMYRHLTSVLAPAAFEFEVAVDEIEHRTTPVDHVYLATELRRLGVSWASLAPRFVGEFEKGIDYLGDRAEFEADVSVHAAIARQLGDYKLSVHSGSDKFSVYDAVSRATRDLVHLKTSGTSYLVALETIAATDPELMRSVWRAALDAYTTARASYHVSATTAGAPSPEDASDATLADLLDDPNTREILHVTYGAVLHGGQVTGESHLGDDLRASIWAGRHAYWSNLTRHIGRHLQPFAGSAVERAPKEAAR
ncbi:MAG: tagaturonate epimerase family protein [Candidatus Limnocylindrales bacterium]